MSDLEAQQREAPGHHYRLGRVGAAVAIIAEARKLQALVGEDPELLRDGALAGEIEGLWMAAKIADRVTYYRHRAEKPEPVDEDPSLPPMPGRVTGRYRVTPVEATDD